MISSYIQNAVSLHTHHWSRDSLPRDAPVRTCLQGLLLRTISCSMKEVKGGWVGEEAGHGGAGLSSQQEEGQGQRISSSKPAWVIEWFQSRLR